MASGYWGFRPKTTNYSGAAWELLSNPPRLTFGQAGGASGVVNVTQIFEGDIWVYDDVLLTYTLYTLATLPPGFQVTFVSMYSGAAAFDLPNIVNSPGDALDPDRAGVTSWTSTIAGWDSATPSLGTLSDILISNEISFVVAWNGVDDSSPFIINKLDGGESYTGFPIPPTDPNPVTAFAGFYLFGGWDDGAAVAPTPGGLTGVTADGSGTTYTIDATPGANTTVVQIETDDGEVIVVPVGALPATVTFVTPPVILTITPINTTPSVTPGPPTVLTLTPAIIMTMSGGIDLGGSATIQYIGNPSGIYTLVPGQTYDTLYERIPAVTSQNVKIPDPFIDTAYVGE